MTIEVLTQEEKALARLKEFQSNTKEGGYFLFFSKQVILWTRLMNQLKRITDRLFFRFYLLYFSLRCLVRFTTPSRFVIMYSGVTMGCMWLVSNKTHCRKAQQNKNPGTCGTSINRGKSRKLRLKFTKVPTGDITLQHMRCGLLTWIKKLDIWPGSIFSILFL